MLSNLIVPFILYADSIWSHLVWAPFLDKTPAIVSAPSCHNVSYAVPVNSRYYC